MIFKRMIEQCGLDRQEAADYLGYSLGAVKKWITGERAVTVDVITKLAVLNDQIEKTANKIASEILENSTAINDKTICLLENDLPVKGLEGICTARAVLIAASKQLAAGNKLKSEQ